MRSKEKKKLFSERLNKVLDQHNFPPKNMGRVSLLAEMFSMTHKGAGNWINAESMPPAKKIDAICEKFNISKEWLVFGKEGFSLPTLIQIPIITLKDIISGNLPSNGDLSTYSKLITVQDSNSQNSFAIDLQDDEFEVDFLLSNKAKLIFDPKKKPADKLFALIKSKKDLYITRLIEYEKDHFATKHDSSSCFTPLNNKESEIMATLSEIKF